MSRELSPQQLRVLAHMSRGLSDKEIASELGLALRTVKSHAAAVYTKMGVRNRTEAAVRFTQMGAF